MQPQEWLPLPSLLGLNWVCVASSPVESQQPPLHRRARYLNRLKLGITPQKAVFQWSTLMPDSAPRSLRYLAKTQGLQMGSTRGADISAGVKGLGSCITWYALHLQNRSISRWVLRQPWALGTALHSDPSLLRWESEVLERVVGFPAGLRIVEGKCWEQWSWSFKYLPEHLEIILTQGMKNYELIWRNRISPKK
jgi:hypothetical protein